MLKIEITNTHDEITQKLLAKFLKMNVKSIDKYDYLENEKIIISRDSNSGYSYAYLESDPSLAISLDRGMNWCLIYRSDSDGLAFKLTLDVKSLTSLDRKMAKVAYLDEKRDNAYETQTLTEIFINKMKIKGWEVI